MLSRRLKAFVIPTSQKTAITMPSTSFETSSTRRPAAIAIPAAANWAASFATRRQVPDVVDEPRGEEQGAAGEDPGEQPRRLDRTDGEREDDAGREAARDPDAAERRRGAVVPALAGRVATRRDAAVGARRRTQRASAATGSGGDRDGRFHGGTRVACVPHGFPRPALDAGPWGRRPTIALVGVYAELLRHRELFG